MRAMSGSIEFIVFCGTFILMTSLIPMGSKAIASDFMKGIEIIPMAVIEERNQSGDQCGLKEPDVEKVLEDALRAAGANVYSGPMPIQPSLEQKTIRRRALNAIVTIKTFDDQPRNLCAGSLDFKFAKLSVLNFNIGNRQERSIGFHSC